LIQQVNLLGIANLDEDHLALGHIIAELEFSGENNAPAAEVGAIADRLVEAARAHFAREEEMMAKHNYPFMEQHRQAHCDVIQSVEGLAGRFSAGHIVPDKDVIAALWNWELAHIDQSDRLYAVFALNEKIGVAVLGTQTRPD
jgi:hemerythrin